MNEQRHKGSKFFTIVVAALIAASMLLYFFTFQVRVNQCVVVTTFDQPTRAVQEPGLYWKWPYPFQKDHPFDTRLQTFVSRVEQLITADHKSIILQTYVGWRIDDAQKFHKRIGKIEKVADRLEGRIRSYTSSVVSRATFSQLIGVAKGNEEDHFRAVEEEIKQLINNGEGGTRENLGIVVEEFGIRSLKLPALTTQKVFARMRAEQNRIAEELRAEGEAQYQQIVSKADLEKRKILIKAQADAKKRRGEANAKAAEYYKIFAEDSDLAIWLRKLEALEKVLGEDRTTLMLGPDTPPFDLLREKFPQSSGEEQRVEKQNE